MSAVYGMCHWENLEYESQIKKMESALYPYKIDRYNTEEMGIAEFGCGIQHFTQEAEREILPFKDERQGILMTADVVLDNRAELMRQLGVSNPGVADGELVYLAYSKWGEEFVKLLRGVFAIAIYDMQKNILFLYTDHTGSRAVNYYNGKEGFAFATTFSCILKAFPQIRYNEKWITACEATISPDMEIFREITPYEGIFQLEAGTYLRVSEHEWEKKVYWEPLKKKEKLPFEDTHCREIFRSTYEQCVKDVLRSRKNTGIMVSSGLDSTGVACIAANQLNKEGKKLYGYTSVPDGEFQSKDKYSIANEAWGAEEIKKQHANFQVNLVPCAGMDGLTKLEELTPLLEIPTKSAPNVMWIDEIYKQCREQECYFLLKGQNGNATVSYGKILTNLFYQMKHFHFLKAGKERKAFAKMMGVSEKRIIKAFFKEWIQNHQTEDYVDRTILHNDLVEKYEINNAINAMVHNSGGGILDNEVQMRNFMFDYINFAQLGLYDTRFSLIHGVLVRDPTKDKRMIELCLSLPIECFVHNGVERRLSREYMQGIIPDKITGMIHHRGEQSADFMERMKRNKEKNNEQIERLCKNKQLFSYIDQQKLEVLLHKYEQKEKQRDEFSLYALLLNVCSLSIFLEKR